MLHTLKKFFNKLFHIGTEKDKDDVVKEITAYHSLDYYNDRDLHDIADGTSREDEINDYIYEQNYGTDKDYDDYISNRVTHFPLDRVKWVCAKVILWKS